MPSVARRRTEPFLIEQGPTAVLLLHGFSGSPAELRGLGEYLGRQGLTVRAPLLPGHGGTLDELDRTRFPQWIRAARRELADLRGHYERVHLVGFSMGGLIGLYLAARFEVASVTTLASPIELGDWRAAFVPVFPQFHAAEHMPEKAAASLGRLIRFIRRDAHRVRAPLLAVHGEQDRVATPASAAYLVRQASSGAKGQLMLPNRGHLITLEHGRDEVYQAVHGWIVKHS
ncbi:MAG: alpha/beta hydrolase [Mycobacterium leprae]